MLDYVLCEASGASAAGSAPEILRLDSDAVPGDQLQQLPGILRRIRMRLLHYVTQKKREV